MSDSESEEVSGTPRVLLHILDSQCIELGPRVTYEGPVSLDAPPLLPPSPPVRVTGCTDVHVGTALTYNGPVTVNRIVAIEGRRDTPNLPAVSDEHGAAPWRRRLPYVGVGVGICLGTLSIAGFYFLWSATNSDGNLDKTRIIRRQEWSARNQSQAVVALKHPVRYVVILHTAMAACSTTQECSERVRDMQRVHIQERRWADIGYSFLVGGDGNAYEGRGWDARGAFALGYNSLSVGIAFIGNFIAVVPPPGQVEACHRVVAQGVRLGKIASDYKLLAHRQLSATESPGEALYLMIKTWPHWAEFP